MIPQLDYAFYVWSSYGLFAVIMAWQFVQPRVRRRQLIAELREEQAIQTGNYDDTDA